MTRGGEEGEKARDRDMCRQNRMGRERKRSDVRHFAIHDKRESLQLLVPVFRMREMHAVTSDKEWDTHVHHLIHTVQEFGIRLIRQMVRHNFIEECSLTNSRIIACDERMPDVRQ